MVDEKAPGIKEFFKGRDIFITGGSGFMGKVLIEKLLRSCPDLNRIFVLIRGKKNKTSEQRLEELGKVPVFDRLHQELPNHFSKLCAINGDCTQIGLGISDEDFKRMENVSVIFHSAASVRFDDALKNAILLNTRGTVEVMRLAEKLKQIRVVLHVSTTYCNPTKKIVEEMIYPPNGDWEMAIKIAEKYDETTLNALTQKFTNAEPNTYTFTKGLAEQAVKDFSDRLPVVIFRPSIVVSSLDEPMPGWIDNFNGPTGLLLACGLGLLRTTYGDPDVVSDFTPVDTSIKAMIVAAWKRGVESELPEVPVYNCSTSIQRKFTTGFIVEMGRKLAPDVPIDKMIWLPGGSITKCKYNNYIRFILFQLFTAFFIDFVFKLTGQRQFVAKLQRRIYGANLALHYFITTHWVFKNAKFLALNDIIKTEDNEDFRFDRFVTGDIRKYFIACMYGARRYLLNEKDENLPRARRNYKRFALAHYTLVLVWYTFLFYTIFIKYNILGRIWAWTDFTK
ncbi:putative fatty acyl-CoA reductase CG5065 [Sitodiplosis mosellana]|uniref:putative fatty acyl-CoA reductase CG5065 n=1 Tax=Sitodiplosis mosellana TaxID=263140 RepID=UPI0024452FCD|nr:putative fatty acyl-CoA reductase CG5065 [Sitodiplosis mosellana]